jgi:hypothetical protein
MMKRTLPPLLRALALGLFCLGSAQCGTAPPAAPTATPPAPPPPAKAAAVAAVAPVAAPPVFATAAAARSALVGSLVTVAPAMIVADLDALSRRLDLPMMLGEQLRSSLSGMGLLGDPAQFQALWERLDPAAPVAVVWVLPPETATRGFCVAMTFRDAGGAKTTFAAMGTEGEQRGSVAARRTPEGDILWGSVKGRTLFVSGSAEALFLAAGLAEAAQAAPVTGQIVLTVLPPALIAGSGRSRDALLAEVAATTASEIKSAPGFATAPSQRFATAVVVAGAKLALDSASIRLSLEVGPQDGLLVETELVPNQGTGFAAGIARRAAYAFDAKLPVRDDGTAVSAIGSVTPWFAFLARLFAATGPAGQAMQRELYRYVAATGDYSCVVDSAGTGIAGLCSSALKDRGNPKAALDAVASMMEAEQAWEAELYGGKKLSPLVIKRSGDLLEIEKKLEQPDLSARAMAKAFAGGETMKMAMKVKDGRLVMATGRDARKTLDRYGKGARLERTSLVARALARGKGAEAILVLDAVSMVLRVLGKGKGVPGAEIAMAAAAMPGLATMKAPFVYALRGGNSLTGEFRIPLGSLENIAKVVRGMFGTAGNSR